MQYRQDQFKEFFADFVKEQEKEGKHIDTSPMRKRTPVYDARAIDDPIDVDEKYLIGFVPLGNKDEII